MKVTKSVDVEGRASVNYKGFYGAVGGYTGKRANDVQGALLPNGQGLHTASREDALIGYKNKMFNIGGEYFHAGTSDDLAKVYQNLSAKFALERSETEVSALFGALAALLAVCAGVLSMLWFHRRA